MAVPNDVLFEELIKVRNSIICAARTTYVLLSLARASECATAHRRPEPRSGSVEQVAELIGIFDQEWATAYATHWAVMEAQRRADAREGALPGSSGGS